MAMGNPQLAWLGLLLLIPLALYLVRRRVAAAEVSSLVFFKSLAREHQESSWLRKWKRWISLFLSLAILGGAILALMRLEAGLREDGLRAVVVVVDRSASMGARSPEGVTRLESVKEELKGRLNRLRGGVEVSVMAFDQRPELLLASTRDLASVRRAVDEVRVRPWEGEPGRALDLAEILAGKMAPAEIWLASDETGEGNAGEEREGGVRMVRLSAPESGLLNVGITAFQLRPVPMQRGRLSCFLEMAGNEVAGEGVEARLEMRQGSVRYPSRLVSLRGGETKVLEIAVDAQAGEELHFRLVADGDCLEEDNEILVRLPAMRPVVAVRVGARDGIDPFTHVALQSLIQEGELQVWSVEPERWPVSGADVVIFDHWLPPEWPSEVPVIVMNPPESDGPLRVAALRGGGIPQVRIRERDREHPVLFRVSSGGLSVAQTAVVDLPPGLEPLWEAERETLLAAGEWRGQRAVVMGFSPRKSARLPLTDAFPLLIGNAIYWCTEERERDHALQRQSLRTGSLVPVAGGEVRWWRPDGGRESSRSSPVFRGFLELDQSGVWQTEAGETGSAHLLSERETREAGRSGPPSKDGSVVTETGRGLPGDLTGMILGLLLALLVVESLFFHRFAVH